MIKYIKKHYKEWLNFIYRNAIVLSVIAITLFILVPTMDIIRTTLIISLFECVAISMSSLACYVFTKINFVKQGNFQALGYIFLSVHILAGLTILGVYLAQIK